MKKQTYITITGINYYYGRKPFEVGRIVKIERKPYLRKHQEKSICKSYVCNGKFGYCCYC